MNDCANNDICKWKNIYLRNALVTLMVSATNKCILRMSPPQLFVAHLQKNDPVL